MAAKGTLAKENVIKKIASAFGADFIGEFDKKVYLMVDDGGEKVQIAVSLTCPKNPIQVDVAAIADDGNWDFSDTPKVNTTVAVVSAAPAEISEEEKENLAALMAKLGL